MKCLTYIFAEHISIIGTSYVAVALSDDRVMGDDSVIECVRENNGVNMYTSYTRVSYTGTDRHDVRFPFVLFVVHITFSIFVSLSRQTV